MGQRRFLSLICPLISLRLRASFTMRVTDFSKRACRDVGVTCLRQTDADVSDEMDVSDVSDVSDIRDGAGGADVTAVVNVADVLDVGSEASPEEGVVSGTGSVDSGSGTLALVFFLVDVRRLSWRERRRSRSVSMCAKRKTVRRRSSSSAGISPVCT